MGNKFERACAELVRARGAAGLWDLVLLAAVWPYMLHPGLQAWFASGFKTSPYATALSLAVTLALIATLRSAIAAVYNPAFNSDRGHLAQSSAMQTLPAKASPRINERAVEGFLSRDAFRSLSDRLDPSLDTGLLGVLRFANYAPMEAYDPTGAEYVLTSFRSRFHASVGRNRPIARLDNHTFTVWITGSAEEATKELKSIAYVLAQEISHGPLMVAPDVHVGRAVYPRDADSMTGLLGLAETRLTSLKRFKDLDRAVPAARIENAGERFAMEQALRRAVRENQLSLCYQPFVDVATGTVTGAEALLRWRHPALGNVPPTRFIPLLEESGLIDEIGAWTLNTACRQLFDWRTGGYAPFRLAINLSAIQLQNDSLLTVITRTVASHGLSPADIELELTETAAMEDRGRTLKVFSELRDRGFGISIDDFGSGHSNLGYLKNLPFTKLKIDREFISRIDTEAGSRAICKALLELASGLGISVLAEGVERIEEVEALRLLGCTTFQGYYFARPLPADEFTSLVCDPEWVARIGSGVHRQREELERRMLA